MSIDTAAVAQHGRFIAFGDLIAFDADRRKACARKAWDCLCDASHSPYGMHDGNTTEEWTRIVHLLADENPHWEPERKAEAMRRVERTPAL